MSLDRTHVEERQLAASYVCLLVSELGGGHGRQCRRKTTGSQLRVFTGVRTRWRTWSPCQIGLM